MGKNVFENKLQADYSLLIASLRLVKGCYVFGSLGLFVSNITKKVMTKLQLNFMEGSGLV